MGSYINPLGDGFELVLGGNFYVDKTELITYTNAVMNTPLRFICFTRPRRFGKTFAAQMLASFYSKGADSRRIFEKMKVAHTPCNKFDLEAPPFDRYLNRCNVLFWDMTRFVLNGDGVDKALDFLQSELIDDLKKEFSNVDASNVRSLADMIRTVYETTGERFYIIIDEWDALFREAKNDISIQKKYIDFLRELFKDAQLTRCICGAYMTGILPIKKYGTSSALTDFSEFSMVDPGELAEYVGFTEEEVQRICAQRNVDFKKMRYWYDGYQFDKVGHIYNPNSVIKAAFSKKFKCYWNKTETY